MEGLRAGCETPGTILASVAAADTPPQFWGGTPLWAKINGLADRKQPLVAIAGLKEGLPQWESDVPLKDFRIEAVPQKSHSTRRLRATRAL